MLEPLKHVLAAQRIVLASGSARRQQILSNIGLKFEVIPSSFEENLDKSSFQHPYEYALATARCKTLEVANKLVKDEHPPDLIIGADTVISMGDDIIEKPADKEHAVRMLSQFCGKNHAVYTGVILVRPKPGTHDGSGGDEANFDIHQFHEKTDVQFADVDAEVIRAYVETGESMDKAGGYGIQGIGGTLVEGVHGDYFNVMGFPLCRFSKELYKLYKS